MIEKFEQYIVLDENGTPISASTDKQKWLEYRNRGVTATDINKIISPTLKLSSQRIKLLETKKDTSITANNSEPRINTYMQHGNEREPIIVQWASGNFNMTGNDVLFHGENIQHLATPDGLGENFVAEIKTSIKPIHEIKQGYMNQIQWQMHVLQVDKCLFLVEQHNNFKPLSIEYEWIYRDEQRIKLIEKHVNMFLNELNNELPF